jgi:hypothetical protein
MRKVVDQQRSLFGPWLAWEQLPNPVRQQVLEMLIELYLEAVDLLPVGEHKAQDSPTNEQTQSQSQ